MFFYITSKVRTAKEQFEGLNLLRAVAALMILIFHAHSIATKHAVAGAFPQIIPGWYSCIEMFFIMSGFLMVHMSKPLYGSASGVKEFVIRRAIRTPPLYYIFTVLVFCIFLAMPGLADGEVTLRRLMASVFFYPLNGVQPVITIGWTLNYEMFFYAITALSIFLSYPFGPLFSIGSLVALVLLGLFFDRSAQPFYLWTDSLLINFAVGNTIAMLFYLGVTISRPLRYILIIASSISLLVAITPELQHRLMFFTPAVGLLVMAFTLRDEPYNFRRVASVINFFGDRAYTMYLCHILALKATEKAIYRFAPNFPATAYMVVSCLVAIGTTAILFELIEKPITSYLRNWLKAMKARRAVGSEAR